MADAPTPAPDDTPPDTGTLMDPTVQMGLIGQSDADKFYARAERNFFRCTCAGCTPDPDIRRYVKTTVHEQPRRVHPR